MFLAGEGSRGRSGRGDAKGWCGGQGRGQMAMMPGAAPRRGAAADEPGAGAAPLPHWEPEI